MQNRLNDVVSRQKKHIIRDSMFALLLLAGLLLAAVSILVHMPANMPPVQDEAPARMAHDEAPAGTSVAQLADGPDFP